MQLNQKSLSMKPTIQIQRVYDEPQKKDGYRVLVDRLWPRGIKKEAAPIDEWAKELAPSTALRKWYGHDPALWAEFQKKYIAELKANEAVAGFIEQHQDIKALQLVYAAKDTEHNHAIVLQRHLKQQYDKY